MQVEELRAQLDKTKAELEEVSEELQEALKQLRKTEVEQEEQLQRCARCMKAPHACSHIRAVHDHLSASASCLLRLNLFHASHKLQSSLALCSALGHVMRYFTIVGSANMAP